MSRHVVAKVGEIAPGQRKLIEVSGRRVGVFNLPMASISRCSTAARTRARPFAAEC